jgi:hypothetical protein
MKTSPILDSVILVLIIMPLLVIPVHASAILPTITCWDGTTIGPVNGTYVAHCSPAPVCPHGQSPMPDRTCLPPCGGSGNMTCMWKSTDGNYTQSNAAEQFMYKTTKYTEYTFNPGYPGQTICDQQGLECYALGLAAGSAHSGTPCPTLYNNQTKQQQFCSGYKDGQQNMTVKAG